MAGWRQRVRLLEEQTTLLEGLNNTLKELVENQQVIIVKQEKHIEHLEKRLLLYENPHTPPSKSIIKPPKKESSGKLGAPIGHPKYEREEPEPTGSMEYKEDTCPNCNARLGKPFKTERIIEEDLPEPQPFEGFHKSFKKIFDRIKKIRERQPLLKTREKWRDKLKLEMEQIIEQMNAYKEFGKFAVKVKNGLEHWFTCLINLLVEPTNNIAERALRELIVQRKIIGGLRREKGARIMEVITSVIATLRKRELPLFSAIKSYL